MKEPKRIKLTSKPTIKDVKKIRLTSIHQVDTTFGQNNNDSYLEIQSDNNENHSKNNSESIQ